LHFIPQPPRRTRMPLSASPSGQAYMLLIAEVETAYQFDF
jgi:hypothetical protein